MSRVVRGFLNLSAKLRWWSRLFAALHPPLAIRSAIAMIVARELQFSRLMSPASAIPVQLTASTRTAFWLRTQDLATLQEVLRDEVYHGVSRYLPSGASVIDLGSNIGLSAVYFLGNLRAASLLAVEPHPESFALLDRNLRPWVASGRCRIIQAAVWSYDCFLELPSHSVPYAASFRIDPKFITDAPQPGFIPGLSMSTLISMTGSEHVDLVKMDIEGSEGTIFTADLAWLRRVGCLAVELHNDLRTRLSFDELLRRHGFDIVDDEGHTVIAVSSSRQRTPRRIS